MKVSASLQKNLFSSSSKAMDAPQKKRDRHFNFYRPRKIQKASISKLISIPSTERILQSVEEKM